MLEWLLGFFKKKELQTKITNSELSYLESLGYTKLEIFNALTSPVFSYSSEDGKFYSFIFYKKIHIDLQTFNHKIQSITIIYKNKSYSLSPIQIFNLTRNKKYTQYLDLSKRILDLYCTKIEADEYIYICKSIENSLESYRQNLNFQ